MFTKDRGGPGGAAMNDIVPLPELVRAAAAGDQDAWHKLVVKYIPLVFTIVRRYRLTQTDAQDVSQTLWLRLLEHLDDVRDPMALPGWIGVTTKNETLRLLKARSRSVQVDPLSSPILDRGTDGKASDEDLLRSERRQMVRDGLDELAPKQRALLLLLVQDPPLTYQEISRLLDIPVGSIGPTRARYLDSLRSTAAMRDYFANET
jgi:RNA polymerase sigma factor (sigma-70 family)